MLGYLPVHFRDKYIAHLRQQCHNTIVSQLKICDFSGEAFKGFEVQ